MNLMIDDKRDMPYGVIARDYESGKKMLALGGWDALYIDHDLGDPKTGYDLITWAADIGPKYDFLPDKIVIISSNPVGRDNIARVLRKSGFKELGNHFYREKGE